MHSALVVADENSLEELNQLLGDNWWVQQIAPGKDGSWLVILTDRDPDLTHAEDCAEECAYEHADE